MYLYYSYPWLSIRRTNRRCMIKKWTLPLPHIWYKAVKGSQMFLVEKDFAATKTATSGNPVLVQPPCSLMLGYGVLQHPVPPQIVEACLSKPRMLPHLQNKIWLWKWLKTKYVFLATTFRLTVIFKMQAINYFSVYSSLFFHFIN